MPNDKNLGKRGCTSRMVTRSYAKTTSPTLPLGSVEPAELSPEPSQHESGTDPAAWAGTMLGNVLNQPVQAGPPVLQATHGSRLVSESHTANVARASPFDGTCSCSSSRMKDTSPSQPFDHFHPFGPIIPVRGYVFPYFGKFWALGIK